jgi:hypothetical protein
MALERKITGHRTEPVLYVERRSSHMDSEGFFFRRFFVSFHVVALCSGVRRGNGKDPEEGGRSFGKGAVD